MCLPPIRRRISRGHLRTVGVGMFERGGVPAEVVCWTMSGSARAGGGGFPKGLYAEAEAEAVDVVDSICGGVYFVPAWGAGDSVDIPVDDEHQDGAVLERAECRGEGVFMGLATTVRSGWEPIEQGISITSSRFWMELTTG